MMKSRSVFALSVCLFLLFGLAYLFCSLFLREYDSQFHTSLTGSREDQDGDILNDKLTVTKKGWRPGRKYTMVDIEQLHVKQERNLSPNARMSGSHTILYFNPNDPKYSSERDNEVVEQECLYSNCKFTKDRSTVDISTAVMFDVPYGDSSNPNLQPPRRAKNQIWILSDTRPGLDNLYRSRFEGDVWKRAINWTLSYRLESDILWTSGTMKTRKTEDVRHKDYPMTSQQRTKYALTIITNCSAYEDGGLKHYITRLKKHIEVDVYGECKDTMTFQEDIDKTVLNYKFLLIFNDIQCSELVPRSFYDHFEQEIVLVVQGGADYNRLLPKDTFVKADEFRDIPSFAKHLTALSEDNDIYDAFLRNKRFYEVSPGVRWQCDLCEKINNKEKNGHIYEDIVQILDKHACQQPPYLRKHSPIFVQVTIVFGIIVFFLTQFWKYCLRFYCKNEDGQCKISYFD